MEFRILGSIDAFDDSRPVALGGAKPRAVLAVLLLHANEPVSAERLAQALWGEDTPQSAVRAVQVHVSRLRKALGDPEILTRTAAGYVLRVRPGELDVERFERAADDGAQLLAEGRPADAAERLRQALSVWRGPALADLADVPFAQVEAARLEELRLTAVEARVKAELESGRHSELVSELRKLVAANPTRERLAAHLMLALYRCGRQSDALDVYHEHRATLDEIGVEPGRELRSLQEAILCQDPALDPPSPAGELPAELDVAGAATLAGRSEELGRLRARWERARAGDGGVVALAGARGSGRTRLAAELAGEVHRAGCAVLYAPAATPEEGLRALIGRALDAASPTLLVLDDLDRANGDDGLAGELRELAHTLRAASILALATVEHAPAGADIERIVLAPLPRSAVRAIAAARAPAHRRDDLPIDWLAEASAGLPGPLHDVVAGWARREASRHVGAVAQRAASGRAELRATEAELAGGVIELQEAVEHAHAQDEASAPIVCPYKGLSSFDTADAQYFFGRERLVAELVARLVGAPLLGIVGPSGSGKSSVMRAGLLPALGSGVVPGSDTWAQVVFRPGEHPLRELREATSGIRDDRRVLVAVDQFEETFTRCEDEAERAAFVAELVRLAQRRRERRFVVLAIRADHYGRCAGYAELAGLLAPNHVLVPPMSADELRLAIERPAHRCGLLVAADLTDALVDGVADEPGALPLLSSALLELWQLRDGRRLTYLSYERAGGVKGAVARLAERAFDRLDPSRQEIARSVLVRLAQVGESGTVERRRVPLEGLEIEGTDAAAQIVDLLADSRLLTIGPGWVEIAHEALLREWPRLSAWIGEDLAGLRIQRGLTNAAQDWVTLGRDDGALYRGLRLVEALDWRDARAPALTPIEREYLDAASRLRDRERVVRRRRVGLSFAGMAAVLVAISVVAVVAVTQRKESDRQRDASASTALAGRAASLLGADPGLSLGLGLLALDRSDTEAARNVVRQATLESRSNGVWRAHAGAARGLSPSADGRRVVTYGTDGRVRVWDVARGRELSSFRARGDFVVRAALSADGTRVAVSTFDGFVDVVDRAGARRRTVLRPEGSRFAGGLSFSPDGRRLAMALSDGAVRVVSLDGGPAITLPGHRGGALTVSFDRVGRRVVSGGADGTARLWDLGSRRATVLHHAGLVTSATFSADGRRVATANDGGVARVWSAAGGRAPTVIGAGRGGLGIASFSADGRRLVTTGGDGVVRIWLAGSGLLLSELRGHHGGGTGAAFALGDRVVVSTGEDGTLRRWLPSATSVTRAPATVASYSPVADRIAIGGTDGLVRVWSPGRGTMTILRGQTKDSVPRFSADGATVVSASFDGTVRSWQRGGESRRIAGGQATKYAAAMDPAGRRIVIGGFDGIADVRDLDGRLLFALRGHDGSVYDAAFSPDGRHIVTASEDGTARVWRAGDGRQERVLRGQVDGVRSAAYSSDGRRIVTAGSDGTVRVWPVAGGSATILYGHEGAVNSARFNGAGDRIVSAGVDGTVRVWDASGGETLAVVYRYRGKATSADFSPDGRHVVSTGSGGEVRVSSCEVCGPFRGVLQLARARADRDVSAAERRRFVHDDG